MFQPAQVAPLLDVLLSTVSGYHGVGSDLQGISAISTPTSAVWPAANRAIYIPLYIDRPGVVTKFWTLNGATVSGNVDIGLYADFTTGTFTRLSSKGSTAHAGTSIVQEYDVTDFSVVPGVYYLGLAFDNVTATIFQVTSNVTGLFQAMGINQQATAFPLPNPAVPAAFGSALVPVAGIAFRTLVA